MGIWNVSSPAVFMSQTHNRPLIIFILGALSTISPFAIDMYLPAFPEMAAGAAHDDRAHFPFALQLLRRAWRPAQFIYGPLLDRFGRKPPLYAGMGSVRAGIASPACWRATSNGSSHGALCRRWAAAPRRWRPWRWCATFSPCVKRPKSFRCSSWSSARRRFWRRASAFL